MYYLKLSIYIYISNQLRLSTTAITQRRSVDVDMLTRLSILNLKKKIPMYGDGVLSNKSDRVIEHASCFWGHSV